MYSTCISCAGRLGRNEALEQFPVGRRIAFDPLKGRLWVLCSRCRSWNLAPIEERWEAVESAERLFERAAVGSSTENVALGRIPEGLELVRVGRVERPEFAGWRYGDRLLERRKRFRQALVGDAPLEIATNAGIGAGTVATGILLTPWLMPVWLVAAIGAGALHAHRDYRRPAMAYGAGGEPQYLTHYQTTQARLVPTEDGEGWSVRVRRKGQEDVLLRGGDALRLLRVALPRINQMGSSEGEVRRAVADVERIGDSDRVLRAAARLLREKPSWLTKPKDYGLLVDAPDVIQLAIELAANEEAERLALAGETSQLEREWREAEELAAIADGLLDPPRLADRIRRWKGANEDSTGA